MNDYKYKAVIEVWCECEENLQFVIDQASDAVDLIQSTVDAHIDVTITSEED